MRSALALVTFCVAVGLGIGCTTETSVRDCGVLTAYFLDDTIAGGHITIDDRNYPVSGPPKNMLLREEYNRLAVGRHTCVDGQANEHGRLTVYSVTQSQ